ncbi:MAG: hypothetical protein K6U74_17250, partial [Firmicutes bacterium]|nr:hypothetical protein [Bacillota bacterium]
MTENIYLELCKSKLKGDLECYGPPWFLIFSKGTFLNVKCSGFINTNNYIYFFHNGDIVAKIFLLDSELHIYP